jgi:hypothetical protein
MISSYLGVAGLTDVGYQFYGANEASIGARVASGITDAGDGWYSAAASVPASAASVRWNSSGQPTIAAREYFSDPHETADAILTRDWTEVSGEAAESLLNAMRSMRNKWSISAGGILTVYKEDGTSVAWQRNVITAPNADSITGMQ